METPAMPAWTVPGMAASYLIGSIPFGYLIARARGVDLFAAGSGNIGATNVGRSLGRGWGFLCFALDFAKGAVPVALARSWDLPDGAAVLIGLAAFLGHLFPVYLRFRGGKGVATGFGVVAVLMPIPALAAFFTWLAVLLAGRVMSVASVAGAVVLAAVEWYRDPASAPAVFAAAAALLVVVKHRANFLRLLAGTESRLADTPFQNGLARMIHVVAVALWFGAGVGFSLLAAPTIFAAYAGHTPDPPEWLPVQRPLTPDLANRLAGAAVAPIFPRYFALQSACGLLALATAWRFRPGRVGRVRFGLVAAAFALVLAGWPIVGLVEHFRFLRYSGDEAARTAFGTWHAVSLMLNLACLGLTGVSTALAAFLPGNQAESGTSA